MTATARGLARTYWLVLSVVSAAPPALAQQGAPASGEWPTYAGDLGSTKYSPLD